MEYLSVRMAASDIPDLRKLLASRSGGRARGKGRGRGGLGGRHELSAEDKDKIVQDTDGDASDSRMSAVETGYLQDPFAHLFTHDSNVSRRFPIINRGTYVRSTAIDTLVDRFLESDRQQPKQILSLGAGSDTRYFRIASGDPTIPLLYHELDFRANTKRKVDAIKSNSGLLSLMSSMIPSLDDLKISTSGDSITSPTYNLTAIDLRDLAKADASPSPPNFSSTTPTLILSECCLCYLPPELAISILDTITARWLQPSTPVSLILYEPIRPFDAFGRMMESNLLARAIHVQTLHRYCNLAAQRMRLKQAGFTGGQYAADIDFIFENWISDSEKERIARCEMLDELEEWRLLAKHYCVAWGWRDDGGDGGGGDVFTRAWKDLPNQKEDGD